MEKFESLVGIKPKKLLFQLGTLSLTIGSALMLWAILRILTNVESPVVVVLTQSMEPAYKRGDTLFITNWDEPTVPGDVMVFQIKTEVIPIVHRAMKVQERSGNKFQENDYYLLTKGDNNSIDDRGLYPSRKLWLHKEDVIGKIRAFCPYMGYVTIALNDNPPLKYAVLACLAFLVIFSNDPDE